MFEKCLLLLWCCAVVLMEGRNALRHTAYTRPLVLGKGQVTNTFHRLPIPEGPIAVSRFQADIVEKDPNDPNQYIEVPIYDAYLHHHVVGSNHKTISKPKLDNWSPMKPASFSRAIGFGAGTECRGTPQEFKYPYRFVTEAGEKEWIANVHVINMRTMPQEKAHVCLECPCTKEDHLTQNGTNINFSRIPWGNCNNELLHEKNNVCSPKTYAGGLRCCEEGEFCLNKEDLLSENGPKQTYYLRYTIDYEPVTKSDRALYLTGCCDASGDLSNHGNIEYDLPKCDPKIHPGCVHTLSTRQYLGGISAVYSPLNSEKFQTDKEIEVVFAVGHQHRSGMGISIYNDATGKLLCNSVPKYGTGKEVMNEDSYVVAMSTCTFDPPLRMKTSDIIRVVSLYNNTIAHTGVMSLFYIAVADVPISSGLKDGVVDTSTQAGSVNGTSNLWTTLVPAFLVAVVAIVSFKQYQKRRGYEPLLRPTTPSVDS